VCVLWARILRKPILLHIHTGRFETYFLNAGPWMKRWIGYIFRKCDLVLVLRSEWAYGLRATFPSVNVSTLPNPVDIPTWSQQDKKQHVPKGKFTLLFLGYLIPAKGIQDMVQLAKAMRVENLAGVKIVVAGKGEMAQWLAGTIQHEGLNQYLQYVGWVDGEEKRRQLLSADAFFLPSYIEGMPISVLEAMAYALPILSTQVGGTQDIVRDGYNGYLCRPGDISGFLAATKKLAFNPLLTAKLGNNSLKWSIEFKADTIFTQLVQIYSHITNGSCQTLEPHLRRRRGFGATRTNIERGRADGPRGVVTSLLGRHGSGEEPLLCDKRWD